MENTESRKSEGGEGGAWEKDFSQEQRRETKQLHSHPAVIIKF